MGVEWGSHKNVGRGSLRPSSPRVVPGAPLSDALLLGHRDARQVGVALADLPAIEQRRRYLAALGRITQRIRRT